jgi:sugar phosphate permease
MDTDRPLRNQQNPEKKVFYGWFIVSIALLANYMSIGSGFYIFNAFMEPLCATRGWSRTDINLGITGGQFAGLVGSFVYGTFVSRIGPRILMTLGPFVAGTAFIFLFRTENLLQFTALCVLLFLANGSYGGIVSGTAVNNWFIEKRGKALGIATIGISLSGASLPFIALLLLLKTSVIISANIIGVSIMLIGPIAWCFIRNWPEEYGLLPDGKSDPPQRIVSPAAGKLPKLPAPWTLNHVISSGTFWKLGFTYVFVLTGLMGVMSQLKPRFSSLGFSDMEAMSMMAATAFVGAFGKYTWGMLCDRFHPQKVIAVFLLCNALGLSFSLIHGSVIATVLFILVFGFAVGGAMSTYPIMVSYFFGRESFPSVMRYTSLLLVLDLSGLMIAGQSFDRFGSYDVAYIIFMVLDLCAILLILSVKNPE